jgi:hypothetical protein
MPMFRRIAKLARARRAFHEGRVEEAFELANDPEIREHLKAERLRADCVEKLGAKVEERVERGELSGALRELHDLAEHAESEEIAGRAEEIKAMQEDRKEAGERARARYFRARLELDRGDLDRADEIVREARADVDSPELRRAAETIDERRLLARREIERAREMIALRPSAAEEALVRAYEVYPRSEELKRTALELARLRIGVLEKAEASDGALASFLVEHGLMKRRLLSEMTSVEQRDLDADLNRLVRRRVDVHLGEGRVKAAAKLLERRRENLAPDADLDGMEESVKGLVGFEGLLNRGEFDFAAGMLEAARKRLGRMKALKQAHADLEKRQKTVGPLLKEAEAALVEGRREDGKSGLLEILALCPDHVVARRRLRAVNEATREKLTRLLEARRLIDRGKYDDAMDILLALEDEGSQSREIALMRREVELLELVSTRRQKSPTQGLSGPLGKAAAIRQDTGDHHAERWILGVEEFGEYLILEEDEISIGSESAGEADLRFLAPLASCHARLRRKTSFHGGCRYAIESVGEAEVRVNGDRQARADLEDGDRVRLGREFEFVFRRPCARSGAARLDLGRSWSASGCGTVLLLPPRGRAGALLIADRPDAHVRTEGKSGDLELFREPDGRLRARGSRGVSVDRGEASAEVEVRKAASLQAEDLVIVVGTPD